MGALTERPNFEPVPVSGPVGSIVDGRYAPPPQDGGGQQWVRASMRVQRSPEELYALWRSFERAPEWMEQVSSVTLTGPKTTHWVMQVGDKPVEWDAEVLADEPGRRIAWRSTGGMMDQAGEVMFTEAPGGRGTIVTVLQEFRMPKLASVAAAMKGREPKQKVIEDLRHFKQLAEAGEIPRVAGQPHGKRGVVGGLKEFAYGETVPTPPVAKAS
ncbi:MAG: SRPBCC family protein [Acidobacteriota bacterium]|nr:SRPBCC family protein [Acidobacteriota bacterium]